MNHLRSSSTAEICLQTYNFLPCTTTALGNLFLVLAYGFLNYKVRVACLTAGTDLLLETIGPGCDGSGKIGHTHVVTLLLPMLGALPDAFLVLASGLAGSRGKAQDQVLVGMGLLAGSTIFLLTFVWGTCVVAGKCDIGDDSFATDSKDTKGLSFTGSGISTDDKTSYTARIMAICVIPFAIALFPKMLRTQPGHRLAILLAAIVSFLLALSYCIFQIFHPWIQERRLEYAKHKHIIFGLLRHASMLSLGRLLHDDGTPNEDTIRKLFHWIDMDESGDVSRSELHALVVGIDFWEIDFDENHAVDKVMAHFDTSGNDTVDEAEFVVGMKKLIDHAKSRTRSLGALSEKFIHVYHERTTKKLNQMVVRSDDAEKSVENPRRRIAQAMGLMFVGTAIPAAFADPLVDAIYSLSKATNMPSFFISFVLLPLVNNSSECVSAVRSMRKKKRREASLTLSEVYSVVTVNNLMCLGMFLVLVYVRDITWDFSSELLIILLVCIIMGLFTSFRTTFPLWTCLVAYSLYPLSLVVVHILDSVFHWS